jgi:hypothetical protein
MLTALKPLIRLKHIIIATNLDYTSVPSAVCYRWLLSEWVPVLHDDREEPMPALNVKHETWIWSGDCKSGFSNL